MPEYLSSAQRLFLRRLQAHGFVRWDDIAHWEVRCVDALLSRGFVQRAPDGYVATLAGRNALDVDEAA